MSDHSEWDMHSSSPSGKAAITLNYNKNTSQVINKVFNGEIDPSNISQIVEDNKELIPYVINALIMRRIEEKRQLEKVQLLSDDTHNKSLNKELITVKTQQSLIKEIQKNMDLTANILEELLQCNELRKNIKPLTHDVKIGNSLMVNNPANAGTINLTSKEFSLLYASQYANNSDPFLSLMVQQLALDKVKSFQDSNILNNYSQTLIHHEQPYYIRSGEDYRNLVWNDYLLHDLAYQVNHYNKDSFNMDEIRSSLTYIIDHHHIVEPSQFELFSLKNVYSSLSDFRLIAQPYGVLCNDDNEVIALAHTIVIPSISQWNNQEIPRKSYGEIIFNMFVMDLPYTIVHMLSPLGEIKTQVISRDDKIFHNSSQTIDEYISNSIMPWLSSLSNGEIPFVASLEVDTKSFNDDDNGISLSSQKIHKTNTVDSMFPGGIIGGFN